jgi:sulfatase modifying factor 1
MRIVTFCLLIGMTLSFIAGCGDNTKPSLTTVSDRGSVTFSVKWPDSVKTTSSRTIPNGTTKIIVKVIQNGQVVNAITINRPSSTGTISAIPVGSATIEAKAYGNNNILSASGSTTITVVKNIVVTAKLTLNGTGWCINPTDGAEMVWVPGGTFTMGADANLKGPGTQQVTLSGYWIFKYEVTVAQYRSFCIATGYTLPIFPSGYSWKNYTNWETPELQQHPIVNVSWIDAKAYADWAGSNLPTEAQWEYAARGTSGSNYPWGGSATINDPYNGGYIGNNSYGSDNTISANYFNSGQQNISTWQVGSFQQDLSWCGAYDMSDNVSEWCADWYGDYTITPDSNPTGPLSGDQRVVRGGKWSNYISYYMTNPTNGTKYLIKVLSRTFDRNYSSADIKDYDRGFRCVSNTPGP